MSRKPDSQAYLHMLQDTAQALGEGLQEREIVHALLTQVVDALAARGALVDLLNPSADELLLAGSLGLNEVYLRKGPVRVAQSQADQRVLAGELVVVSDVARESGIRYSAAASEGLQSAVVVPLSLRGRAIGLLRIFVDDAGDLGREELLAISTLANWAAIILERSRLLESLYRIAEALNSSLELQPMLQQVLEAVVREMWLRAAAIRLLDPKWQVLRLVAAHGLSEAYLAKGEVYVAKSPVDQRVLRGEVVVLYDVEHEPGLAYPEEAAREGIRSVLAVPLRFKEHTLGVMRVYSAQPRYFGSVAKTFLTSISDLLALAIENVRLYSVLQERYEELKLDLAEWYRFLALG